MYASTLSLFIALTACTLTSASPSAPTNCTSSIPPTLLSLYNTTILTTTHYPTNTYNISGLLNTIPFCEITASIPYSNTKNNTLTFALWLPLPLPSKTPTYSSRFLALGNGGQGGLILYSDMLLSLNQNLGFAIAGGNAGHWATDNDAGVGLSIGAPGVYQQYLHDDEQVLAWLRDAFSIFTPAAKEMVGAFYGREVRYSYFSGCSGGGAQAFSLAEFHEGLFDGVVAGCPANWFTHLMLGFLWNKEQFDTPTTTISAPLLDFMQASVLRACDTLDGVQDNLIENPLACHFDITSLACTAETSNTTTCLTPPQLSAVKAVYRGPYLSSTNTSLFPGLSIGSEAGWSLPSVSGALSNAFSVPVLQNLVYNNLSYDPRTFSWDTATDVQFLDARAGPLINSISTDLSSFRNKGGKLLVYAGWADPNIAPMWAMQHSEAIIKATIGRKAGFEDNDFLKLVMVPGGGHCGGQIAKYPYIPARYGFPGAMIDWVEKGIVPVKGIKSWGPTDGGNRTRRLCTWPRLAKLKRGGDANDWESYVCA